MTLPDDDEVRASVALSGLIEALVDDPYADRPITLGVVRARLRQGLGGQARRPDPLSVGDDRSLSAEVEALIERFGEQASVGEFTAPRASESLSAVIETLLDESDSNRVPTLGNIRDAIDGGVLARLAGEGLIEANQAENLRMEIDRLLSDYGREVPAEKLLGFR